MEAENRYIFPPISYISRLITVDYIAVAYGEDALFFKYMWFHSLGSQHGHLVSHLTILFMRYLQPYLYYIKKIDLMRILIDRFLPKQT